MNLLKDDIRRLFYYFLVPAISSAVAVATYSLIDTIAIGQGVGPDGTAACSLVLPIFFIANFIALLCGIGGSVLRNRAGGEGNKEKGNAFFSASIVLVAVLTLIAWIGGWVFQEPFYRLCGADDVLLPYAMDYGSWIFATLPSFVLTTFLGCYIRSDGYPRFVLYATLIGGVINIIGDWLFVFPLNMGMEGAGIATALGSVVQAGLMAAFLLLKKTSFRLVKPYAWTLAFKKIVVTGFGSGIGALAVIAVSFIANNQIMKYAGSASLAVYGVLGTVSALFTSIFSGIGQAVQPIAATNFGAGNLNRSWKVGKLGIKNAVLFSTLFAGISIAIPVEVVSIFMKMTPEVEEVTPFIMRVFSLSYIPQAFCMFAVYFLQAVQSPKMATIISLLRGILLNGGFLMIFPLFLGGKGVWWAILSAEVVTMTVAAIYLLKLYKTHCSMIITTE